MTTSGGRPAAQAAAISPPAAEALIVRVRRQDHRLKPDRIVASDFRQRFEAGEHLPRRPSRITRQGAGEVVARRAVQHLVGRRLP